MILQLHGKTDNYNMVSKTEQDYRNCTSVNYLYEGAYTLVQKQIIALGVQN